jgi:hypothetical protein
MFGSSRQIETNKCLLFIHGDWAFVGFMGNVIAQPKRAR